MKKLLVSIILAATVSSCASGLPKVNAISASRIDGVLAEIKRQLSIYQNQAAHLAAHPEKDAALNEAREAGFQCGKGLINFEITAIDAELTTTSSQSAGGSLGFSAVVPAGTIGPTLSGSHTIDNTQKLKFSIYPGAVPADFRYPSTNNDAIADLLFKLRAGFLKTATKPGGCYYVYNPKSENGGDGNTYEIGLTVTDDAKGEIAIKLAPVEAGFNGTAKSVTGNTLTIHFAQRFDQRGNSPNGFHEGEGAAVPRKVPPAPETNTNTTKPENKTGG